MMRHGRKFALAVAFLALSAALMAASFVLAWRGALTDQWVQLANVWLMTGTTVLAAFSGANAWITGRTTGVDSKP